MKKIRREDLNHGTKNFEIKEKDGCGRTWLVVMKWGNDPLITQGLKQQRIHHSLEAEG